MTVNETYGYMTVLSLLPQKGAFVVCKCGTFRVVRRCNLRSGNTQSCGCLRETHGHWRHGRASKTYISWQAMKARCLRTTHHKYPIYGAKGVTVCDRWLVFENFLTDMGERPPSKTLDRYPNKAGNYEPGNVRWATITEQNNNRVYT